MKFSGLTLLLLPIFTVFFTGLQYGQENYALREVNFIGNQTFSSGRLLEEMSLHGTSGFQKTILRKKPLTNVDEFIPGDVERLIRFYQREGFLDVKIPLPQKEVNEEKQTINLTFRIHEGKPVLVDSVYFKINSDSGHSEEKLHRIIENLSSSLKLHKGERFRDEDAESDQIKLNDRMVNRGYPYVEIERELSVKPDSHTVSITWHLESGPPCTFGDIEVRGNERVSPDVILQQLAFKEGETYRRRLIDKTQQQLYALGVFQIVTVKAILTQEKTPVIPMIIQIQEAPKFTAKFGIGYGTEEKLRVSADTRRLSFLGGARQLNLFLKHSSLEPYRVDLQLTQPAFITPQTVFTTGLFIRKETEPGYTVERKGGSVSLIHSLTRYVSGSVSYVLEEVAQDTTGFSESEVSASGFEELYNKSSIILGLRYDSSRPLFTPDRGMLSNLTFKMSGIGLNTAYDYFKILWDWRRYESFSSNKVIAFRVKIGGIIPYNRNDYIPSEDRFYSGGSSSVRGWGRSLLGPLDAEGKPVGGNSLLEGSVEPRFPIYGPVGGVFFIDFGNVWSNSFTYKLYEIRYSWGVGLRYGTPIGPVRLDVAKPIFDEEDRIQIHISVGNAF